MNPAALAVMWFFTAVTIVVAVASLPHVWIPLLLWGLYVLYAITV